MTFKVANSWLDELIEDGLCNSHSAVQVSTVESAYTIVDSEELELPFLFNQIDGSTALTWRCGDFICKRWSFVTGD